MKQAKTFSLSHKTIDFLESQKNKSGFLDYLVEQYIKEQPAMQKQEALAQFRQAAKTLKNLGFPTEAVISWAQAAIEDED